METIKCIETRRSIRVFNEKQVDRETIKKIIELAMWAPTWKNSQTQRFIAIDDRAKIDEVAKFMPVFNKKNCSTAPVIIAASAIRGRSGFEKDGTPSTDLGEAYTYFDCGAACQTLCLAANDMGLGTVEIGIFDEKNIKKILSIPEEQDLLVMIALGHPEMTDIQAPKRKAADDVLKFA